MFAIIPAAGKATRFNGIYKELLPINEEGDTGLSNALKLAKRFGVRMAYIITNEDKNSLHHRYREQLQDREFKNGTLPLSWITEQQYSEDLWGAIQTGNDYFLDDPLYSHCIMIMPDTIPVLKWIPKLPNFDFALGLFSTTDISRYSIYRRIGNKYSIVTKPEIATGRLSDRAWGMAIWSKSVAMRWKANSDIYINNAKATKNSVYDEAFNDILKLRLAKRHFFYLDRYHDIGSWERYVEYIKDVYNEI